jgi:hypothetical protein
MDDPERTKFFCRNWGCGIVFVKVDDGPKVCNFHPGVWQFASHNGLWPEAWSCCERGWFEAGCTHGYHNGVRLEKRLLLCLNHGEPNPKTNHPDSACGTFYTQSGSHACKFHSGHKVGKKFTCCGGESELSGCQDTTHVTVEWPDEKAKLYFYPKSVNNPGTRGDLDRVTVGQQIARCDFFKPISKPYENPKTKMELLKLKREKEKDEPRYCLRWGCDKIFKETVKKDKKAKNCRCHPGRWDHGSTGTTMEVFVREMDIKDVKSLERQTILWKPHWTCCRKDWNEPGNLNI